MPLTNILEIELFDVCDIYFMGKFPQSFGNLYILMVVDYVSQWIEAVPTLTNDAKVVTKFLIKKYFLDMARLEKSLVMREPTFAINCLKILWKNMG